MDLLNMDLLNKDLLNKDLLNMDLSHDQVYRITSFDFDNVLQYHCTLCDSHLHLIEGHKLEFLDSFNKNIKGVVFPDSIYEIKFGHNFNKDLSHVTWPSKLLVVIFSAGYTHKLDKVIWPQTLHSMIFTGKHTKIYMPLSYMIDIKWPQSLHTLSLGWDFNQCISDIKLPVSLRNLIFGKCYNQDINDLSSSLCHLNLGYDYDRNINHLPNNLYTLYYSAQYNQVINHKYPNSLNFIHLGDWYNLSLDNVVFPSRLQTLIFSYQFNQPIQHISLPDSIITLDLGNDFNHILPNNMPKSLEIFRVSPEYTQDISHVNFQNVNIIEDYSCKINYNSTKFSNSLRKIYHFDNNQFYSGTNETVIYERPVGKFTKQARN
jgi:hypothetical protein